MDVLVLADDLTGALEVGSSFAQTGRSTGVYLHASTKLTTDICVVNTDTRNASESKVREIYDTLTERLNEHQGFIYKKIDSTLRGNIKNELEHLWQLGFRKFVIAPAYPKLERVTKAGYQYIKGHLVTDSASSRDPRSPVTTSFIPDLLANEMRKQSCVIQNVNAEILNKGHVLIVDITTDEDLHELATALLNVNYRGIIVGSNGLAQTIAQSMGQAVEVNFPPLSSLLVISGSNHPATHQQLEALAKSGVAQKVLNDTTDFKKPVWLLESPREVSEARAVQHRLKQDFIQILKRKNPDGLLIIGGETAQTLLSALDVTVLLPIQEIAPGVPISIIKGGVLDSLPVITKSGGFGEPQLLVQIMRDLNLTEKL